MTNLSLTRALQIIKQAGPKPVRSRPARSAASKPKKVTSFDALAWWLDISPEQRRHFIDGIGSRDLAAAIPPSWNLVLVRADAGESIGRIGRLNERIAQLENKLRDRNRRIEKLQRQLGPVFGVAKAEASPEKPASDLDADLDILPAAGGDSMMCTPIGADADVHVAKGPR
jgi:hypothetical protein